MGESELAGAHAVGVVMTVVCYRGMNLVRYPLFGLLVVLVIMFLVVVVVVVKG